MTLDEESRADSPPPEEEPRTDGTIVILMLFMMALVAMWALMYTLMLER